MTNTEIAPANPFAAGQQRHEPDNSLARSDQARSIAEVQAALVIARANPRDQLRAMDRILTACQRPSLAESALYSYARGGTDITGPSIRLAEAVAQCWGNLQFGIRELEQRHGESVVQTYAWDVETNTRAEKTFAVPHVRHTRQGRTMLEDPRDIYEAVANQGARRLRACILAVIPGDVVEAAVAQCEQTMHATADTGEGAIKKLLDAFLKVGVTREQIETRIQRRIDAITPAQVVGLRKIFSSMRDGMSAAADWFQTAEPITAKGAEKVKAALKRKATKDDSDTTPSEPQPGEWMERAAEISEAEAAEILRREAAEREAQQ